MENGDNIIKINVFDQRKLKKITLQSVKYDRNTKIHENWLNCSKN